MQIIYVILNKTEPEKIGSPLGVTIDNSTLLDQTINFGLVSCNKGNLLSDNSDVQVAVGLLETGLSGHAQHVGAYYVVIDVLVELFQTAFIGESFRVGLAGIMDLFKVYPFAIGELSQGYCKDST
uniref:Odorant-binding protein n=1 Tax=Anoplophora chinensis TaxID=217632 RepID=A0A2H4ZB25_ANOCN|nr:odorant-binding protein [Anoplophora chinensis]